MYLANFIFVFGPYKMIVPTSSNHPIISQDERANQDRSQQMFYRCVFVQVEESYAKKKSRRKSGQNPQKNLIFVHFTCELL